MSRLSIRIQHKITRQILSPPVSWKLITGQEGVLTVDPNLSVFFVYLDAHTQVMRWENVNESFEVEIKKVKR